jgi:hypothetical protein
VGSIAAEHRGHEVALAGSVHRLAGGDLPVDQRSVTALREIDADSGAADVAMTRWEGITTWVVHGVLVTSGAAVLLLGVGEVDRGRLTTAGLFGVMAYLLVLHGPAIRFARQLTRTAPLLVSARQLGMAVGAHAPRPTG